MLPSAELFGDNYRDRSWRFCFPWWKSPWNHFPVETFSSLGNWTKKNCSGLSVLSKCTVKYLLKKSRSKLAQLETNQNQGHLYWSSLKISFVLFSCVAPKVSWILWCNENAVRVFFPPVFFFSIVSNCHSLIKGCHRHRALPWDNQTPLVDNCWGEDKQEQPPCKCQIIKGRQSSKMELTILHL